MVAVIQPGGRVRSIALFLRRFDIKVYYVLLDSAVLGVLGFAIGFLFGWIVFGFSFSRLGWPGIVTLVAGSIAGMATWYAAMLLLVALFGV